MKTGHPEWWITARRLRKGGMTEAAIGERFGVTRSAVTRALHPERYVKYEDAKRAYSRERRLARLRAGLGPWMRRHGVTLSDDALLELKKAMREVKTTMQPARAA